MRFLRNETVCFTGHRYTPKSVFGETRQMVEFLISRKRTVFFAGGALGFDTIAAEAVLAAREKYPFIRLVLAIPCPDQDALWSAADRNVYRSILSRADSCVVLADRYSPACMHVRNHYMVDCSSVCVAYYDGSAGGTAATVAYARSRGVAVLNLCKDTTDAPQLTL